MDSVVLLNQVTRIYMKIGKSNNLKLEREMASSGFKVNTSDLCQLDCPNETWKEQMGKIRITTYKHVIKKKNTKKHKIGLSKKKKKHRLVSRNISHQL